MSDGSQLGAGPDLTLSVRPVEHALVMQRPEPARELHLQRVLTDRPTDVRPLYWRVRRAKQGAQVRADLLDGGAIRVGPGTTLSFDTYFGAFFEQHWRLHTRLDTVALRIEFEGVFSVRVWRAGPTGERVLHDAVCRGETTFELAVPKQVGSHRQCGALLFSLTALDTSAILRRADWVAVGGDARTVGLAAVFCTFNREADMARVLAALADDEHASGALSRIYVVNQGSPGLLHHQSVTCVARRLKSKLCVIEQPNLGGAGGFTRGMLAALDDGEASHVVLLDDDIRIEPESLARMSAFFALAAHEQPVGGHMLDSLQPLRLFEAGAIIDPRNWAFHPQHHMLDLSSPRAVVGLGEGQAIHYNGWWCFGIPLALIRTAGLPLPCFIRGDDLEYGLRLHQRGVFTIPLPGVAVWHEPFYIKTGSWQLYYETRNMLIAAALHLDFGPREVAIKMMKHLLIHLLTFRYYSAALIVRAIEDFMAGPALLEQDPRTIHATVQRLRSQYASATTSARAVLAPEPVRDLPKARIGYFFALAHALMRNWLAPTRNRPPRRMYVGNFAWITLARAEHIALDTGWDTEHQVLSRSRRLFRALSRTGVRAIARLYRRAPSLAQEWQKAAPRLTSEKFWAAYVGQRNLNSEILTTLSSSAASSGRARTRSLPSVLRTLGIIPRP